MEGDDVIRPVWGSLTASSVPQVLGWGVIHESMSLAGLNDLAEHEIGRQGLTGDLQVEFHFVDFEIQSGSHSERFYGLSVSVDRPGSPRNPWRELGTEPEFGPRITKVYKWCSRLSPFSAIATGILGMTGWGPDRLASAALNCPEDPGLLNLSNKNACLESASARKAFCECSALAKRNAAFASCMAFLISSLWACGAAAVGTGGFGLIFCTVGIAAAAACFVFAVREYEDDIAGCVAQYNHERTICEGHEYP
jgi:hypothetical protein